MFRLNVCLKTTLVCSLIITLITMIFMFRQMFQTLFEFFSHKDHMGFKAEY